MALGQFSTRRRSNFASATTPYILAPFGLSRSYCQSKSLRCQHLPDGKPRHRQLPEGSSAPTNLVPTPRYHVLDALDAVERRRQSNKTPVVCDILTLSIIPFHRENVHDLFYTRVNKDICVSLTRLSL